MQENKNKGSGLKSIISWAIGSRTLFMLSAFLMLGAFCSPLLSEEQILMQGPDMALNHATENDTVAAPSPEPPSKELSELKTQRMEYSPILGANEPPIKSLAAVLERNARLISSMESRLLQSNTEKEIEINQLNAALGAAIMQAENAEKVRIDLEAQIQQGIADKKQELDRLTESLNAAQVEAKAIQLLKQDLGVKLEQTVTEKDAEIARLSEALDARRTESQDLQSAKDELTRLLDQTRAKQQEEVARLTEENTQTNARLAQAQLENQALLTELQDAKHNVAQQEQRISEFNTSLAALELEEQRLQGALADSTAKVEALADEKLQRTTQLQATMGRLKNTTQTLDDSRVEFSSLEQQLTKTRQELVDVTDREASTSLVLDQLMEEKQRIQQQLETTQARLTPQEGGAATIDSIQQQASELGESYREIYRTQGADAGQGDLRLEDGRNALLAEQMLLVRLFSGKGIYTVQTDDSLSRVSYLMYGSSIRWPDIFKANSHILKDPNHLVPGLPLVIP